RPSGCRAGRRARRAAPPARCPSARVRGRRSSGRRTATRPAPRPATATGGTAARSRRGARSRRVARPTAAATAACPSAPSSAARTARFRPLRRRGFRCRGGPRWRCPRSRSGQWTGAPPPAGRRGSRWCALRGRSRARAWWMPSGCAGTRRARILPAGEVAGTGRVTESTSTTSCQNCGTELLGPHCYRCGQPVNGLVRHFGSLIGDFFDSVFDLDSRTPRTLWPLFAKPGFLTREYFAGHRVRYVSPVRLFFFLSIVTFFVAQLTFHVDNDGEPGGGKATVTVTDPDPDKGLTVSFNGRQWDPVTNPVDIAWLPAFADRWINQQIGDGLENAAELQADPERFKDAVLGALPSTLFVLLPIFALMLKIIYLFRRRLYMEHLIVALHSHAFLCLAVLLLIGLSELGDVLPVLETACNWMQGLLFLWMPLYLLLMQKRVYGQGWPLT